MSRCIDCICYINQKCVYDGMHLLIAQPYLIHVLRCDYFQRKLMKGNSMGDIRTFDGGATRDTDTGKLDFEGFLSPLVLTRYAEYLNKHRIQSDGNLRDSDNWQHGIPLKEYMKSAWRHFVVWWTIHRGWKKDDGVLLEDSLAAVLFNTSGYLHEILKYKKEVNKNEKV